MSAEMPAVHTEQVRTHQLPVFLGVGLLYAIIALLVLLTAPTSGELWSLALFTGVMLGFFWFLRPLPLRVDVTATEIVLTEGKRAFRITRADVARTLPCLIRLHGRGGGFTLKPSPGRDDAELQPVRDGLAKAPPRGYGLRTGPAVAVLLRDGSARLVPTDAPDELISALA